ncbi:MAG: hypothetical protein JJU45_03660 [Acidimicrobiia bacterium]|nr:hypothetical protein [Acidimicrobiia bacterium]
MTGDAALADGTYEVLVVDADDLTDGPGLRLELTVVSGEHKGEVVAVAAAGMAGEVFELLGMPGRLTVADGVPAFELDR